MTAIEMVWRPVPLWRRVALPSLVAVPFAAATTYVALVSPFTHHYSTCPVLDTFGVFCPGCGGLRAVHALTRGDVVTALDMNAYGIVFAGLLVGLWVWWLVGRVRATPVRARLVAFALFTMLAVLPVFTVLRNLPIGQVLAP